MAHHGRNEDIYLNKGGANEVIGTDLVRHRYPPIPNQEYLTLFCKPKTGDTSFTGSGLNDLVSGCNDYWVQGYIGEANAIYDIKISTEGTPDKYQVRKDGGSWSAEKEIIGYNNILTGGVASAKNYGGSDTPAKACDGNIDTRWRGTGYCPTWWAYDLGVGNEKVVTRVSLRLGSNLIGTQYYEFIYKIKIQASNVEVPGDGDWTDLTSEITRRAIGIMIDFENSTAYRHYRVYFIDMYYEDEKLYNDEGVGVYRTAPRVQEIEMYEQVAGSGYIHLGEDVYAKFVVDIGHTLDDMWTINCQGYTSTNDGLTKEKAFNSITNSLQSLQYPVIAELDLFLCDGQNYFEQVQTFWSTTRLSAGILFIYSNSYNATKVLVSYPGSPFYIYSSNLSIYINYLSTRIYKSNNSCVSAHYHSNVILDTILFGDNNNSNTSATFASYGSRIQMMQCGNIDSKKVTAAARINNGGQVNIDTSTDVGDGPYQVWAKDAGIITKGPTYLNVEGGVLEINKSDYDDTIAKKHTQNTDTQLASGVIQIDDGVIKMNGGLSDGTGLESLGFMDIYQAFAFRHPRNVDIHLGRDTVEQTYVRWEETQEFIKSTDWRCAQSFKVHTTTGICGIASAMRVYGNPGDITLEVQGVDVGGKPDGIVLGSKTYTKDEIYRGAFTLFWFDTQISVTADSFYFFILKATGVDANNYYHISVPIVGSWYEGTHFSSDDAGVNWTEHSDSTSSFYIYFNPLITIDYAFDRSTNDIRDAVDNKHTPGTDQKLDEGGGNEVAVADIKDAVDKKHDQKYIINAQTDVTYQLVLTDAYKLITLTNASPIAVTIPTNAVVEFPIGARIDLIQGGAGKVTFSGSVTIKSKSGDKSIAAQYVAVSLIKEDTDTWYLIGELIA